MYWNDEDRKLLNKQLVEFSYSTQPCDISSIFLSWDFCFFRDLMDLESNEMVSLLVLPYSIPLCSSVDNLLLSAFRLCIQVLLFSIIVISLFCLALFFLYPLALIHMEIQGPFQSRDFCFLFYKYWIQMIIIRITKTYKHHLLTPVLCTHKVMRCVLICFCIVLCGSVNPKKMGFEFYGDSTPIWILKFCTYLNAYILQHFSTITYNSW